MRPEVDRKLCASCAGKERWYPTPVSQLDLFLNPHIKKTSAVPNGYAIRKNICYGIQHLQYLSETLTQFSLTSVLITMTYKQFIVTGMAIIEGILYNELKARDLLRTNAWELLKESSSPETDIGGAVIKVDTRILRKRSVPVEEEPVFDRLLRVAEKKRVFGTDSKFYAQAHHLRKLRNKVHLFLTGGDLDSDWKAFGFKEFELMKTALLALLSGKPFSPGAAEREYLKFLAPWKALGVPE